jgi:aldehyde:ferredoxin oxidoreductase
VFGYAGKILRIDLSNKRTKICALNKSFVKEYLGGNGFGAKILYYELKKGANPLGEENELVFATGPFTGTPIFTSGKFGFFAKSPLTNRFGESICGGHIGAELKYAGFDILIIEGCARDPVYIYIEDDDIQIESACHLWGMDTFETEKILKKDHNNKVRVACIGPAGENKVLFASINCDYGRQAGRTGLGAVMGSKKLKAIAVRGSRSIKVADPTTLTNLLEYWLKFFQENPVYYISSVKYGTAGGGFIERLYKLGVLPIKNWQSSGAEDISGLIPENWVPKHVKKGKGCQSCIRPCGKIFYIDNLSLRKGVVEGPEYETLYSLGSNCGIFDAEIVAKANELCDKFGMDTISTGVVIGFAMECYEKGILTKSDVSYELKFGDKEALLNTIEKIAYRVGIGNLLADGVKRAANQLGKGSEKFAIHVKGLEAPGYDVRGLKGMGLGYAVSNRGACHLRSCIYTPELYGKFWKFTNVDRLSIEGKALMLKELEDLMTIYDSLLLCKFVRSIFTPDKITPLILAVTGMNISPEVLMKIGEKIWNLERLFNLREGVTTDKDNLPPRIFEEPIAYGGSRGSYIKKEEFSNMLLSYYRSRGWQPNNG